jgi:soluble lytic murein transglycosylase-like protein
MWNPLRRRAGLIGIFLPLNGLLLAWASPLSQPVNSSIATPASIRANPEWYLRGGLLTGRFLEPRAQADWPLWMQSLIGARREVSAKELGHADLYKIPDAFLVQGIQVLEANRVFQPRILRQATAIGYTARAAEWQEAKSSYQIAYLKAVGLPMEDPLTTSRLMTQLAYQKEFDLLRQSMKAARLPPGSLESFLRLVDLREGSRLPSEPWVLDPTRPAAERLPVLMALKHPAIPERLLAAFKGTSQFDLAIYHAVNNGWITLANPLVSEVILLHKQPDEATLWFLNRPEERVSDLLWMRAMEALRQGAQPTAVACAKEILDYYPDSFYAGHAGYLLAGLEPTLPRQVQPALRVPGDITLLNAGLVRSCLQPLGNAWPERVQALVARNRFDLILARADPEKEEALFLRAAFQAGQQDLVARYLAVEHRCRVETAPFLFPLALEPLVARLIREEGLTGAVDPAFVLAMIKNESIFQPGAQSGADAFGIMQLLRPTFTHMAGRSADILDPETNIRAGLRYYLTVIKSAQLEALPEHVRLLYILAGYHAGEGRARRWRLATEAELQGRITPLETMLRIDAVPITATRQYILRVLGDRELFRYFLSRTAG